MRAALFLVTLFTGFALAATGFALAAPIGPTSGPEFSNPRVPGAAGIFVVGVVLMFFSAVLYELAPDKPEE